MGEALSQAGRWRALEFALESALPSGAAIGASMLLYATASRPSASAPLSLFELAVILAAIAGLTSWAAARQVWIAGDRRVGRAAITGISAALLTLTALGSASSSAFEKSCSKELRGTVQVLAGRGWAGTVVCQAGGVDGNGALRGMIFRSRWDGALPLVLWPLLVAVSGGVAVGLRGSRLRPTEVPRRLAELLTLTPAGGLATALGDPRPTTAHLIACANRTWWGASCGQLYSPDRAWAPGEWCRRCRLPFRPYATTLVLDVIVPVSTDVATLNAMERVDAQSWAPGAPPRTLGSSVSGQARWIKVGEMSVPAILPVSQVIALAVDLLPAWAEGASPAVVEAVKRATAQASRVVAWLWGGPVAERLHVATPTRSVVLISGGQRLRTLIAPGSGRLTLQLDLGVLPIEVREGYVHSLLPESRLEVGEPWTSLGYVAGNLQFTTWIATRPEGDPSAETGAWVPRIEGEALLRWLRRERPPRAPSLPAGATRPAPYTPWRDPRRVQAVVGLLDLDPGALGSVATRPEVALQVLTGPDDPAISSVDVVVARADPDTPESRTLLSALARRPEAPALIALSPGSPWSPADVKALALSAWLHLPLEPDEPDELVFLAREAAGARLARPETSPPTQASPLLDYALTPLIGQQRWPRGPSEPTLRVQPRLSSGEPSEQEPALEQELPVGAWLSEWDWFELSLIARLRREVVVLSRAPDDRHGGAA